jgi:crossover junction endodeoxyribonuclease RuvC
VGDNQIPLYEYGPQEIKVAVTGYGKSDKHHVAHMLTKLISIEKHIRHDDEFDAIAVALTHLAHVKNTG